MEVEKITELEKLRQFLLTYPNWEAGKLLYIDRCDGGQQGLFPQGVEEVARHTDVLGNTKIHCRLKFILYRSAGERAEDAAWLLAFQKWLGQMSAQGKAPQFGDAPGQERLKAEKGHFDKARGNGGLYAVTLTAEFVKIYEEDANGEN